MDILRFTVNFAHKTTTTGMQFNQQLGELSMNLLRKWH